VGTEMQRQKGSEKQFKEVFGIWFLQSMEWGFIEGQLESRKQLNFSAF
jgi:hypothetical protein